MYDAIAILTGYTTTGYDASGNPIRKTTRRPVYVQPRTVYAAEYYRAAQAGFHPSVTLYMTNRADYKGEKTVIYDGVEYKIVRTDWKPQRDGISLICEEKVKNA